jgi:DNA-binding XRE family transcriptional regulator
MNIERRKRLENDGWRIGSAEEFLGLKPDEIAIVQMRLSLSQKLRARRIRIGLSQAILANRLGSSQSRVAKMEAGEPNVSLELLVRAMLLTGAKPREVGRAFAIA